MKLECIEFKRCCFCIPLRYGLIVSGYLKLVRIFGLPHDELEDPNWGLCALMLWGAVYLLIQFASTFQNSDQSLASYFPRLILFAIGILIILLDAALTIVFIVGGHKKNTHLIGVYYYYSIVIFVAFFIAFILLEGYEIYTFILRDGIWYSVLILKGSVFTGFTNLGFQAYMILLTRSEIAKLENNRTFRFVNNAAEGECTMVKELNGDGTCVKGEPVVDDEKNSEEIDTQPK